jgi:hypothetical protein
MAASFKPFAMARRLVAPAACKLLIVGAMSLARSAATRWRAAMPSELAVSILARAPTAELRSSSLRGGKRGLGSGADPLAFVLSNHGHDANSQAVGVRHVGGDKVNASVTEAKQEIRIPRQAIQLGDDELGAVQPASGERGLELRPIGFLAGLDLDEFRNQLPPAAVEIIGNRGALRFNTKAADALPIG